MDNTKFLHKKILSFAVLCCLWQTAYQELSKDKHTLHLVMVTTCGVVHNSYYNMVQKEITMDDLFAV